MLHYLFYMIHVVKYLQPGDYLVFDGEKAFSTATVTKYLAENDITPVPITASSLHQLLNPPDNNFHSVFKAAFYRELARRSRTRITDEFKIRLSFMCYLSIGSEAIKSTFERCGLVSVGLDKRAIVERLVHEGLRCVGDNSIHRRQLIAFLEWCRDNNHFELTAKLDETSLRYAYG